MIVCSFGASSRVTRWLRTVVQMLFGPCPNCLISRKRQDLELLPMAALLHQTGAWNDLNKVPMHQWLLEEPAKDQSERMTVLGNVVVPACARVGASIALGMARKPSD